MLTIFNNLSSNIIFNEIEYFTYLNLRLLSLFFFIILFFISLLSSLLFFSTVYLNDVSMELIITLFSLVYLLYTISPALVILLDSDINILPSFIVNCPGYQ